MKEVLAYILQSERITNVKLAAILDVAPASISHILSGRNKPSYDFLVKLVEAFPRYDARWIVTGKGEPMRANGSEQSGEQSKVASAELFDFGLEKDDSGDAIDMEELPDSAAANAPLDNPNASTFPHPGTKTRLIVCYPDRTFIEYEQK